MVLTSAQSGAQSLNKTNLSVDGGHGYRSTSEQPGLLDAVQFMDANECRTVIATARDTAGRNTEEVCDRLDRATAEFSGNVKARFKRAGEW